jgi:hypothetical protein
MPNQTRHVLALAGILTATVLTGGAAATVLSSQQHAHAAQPAIAQPALAAAPAQAPAAEWEGADR